MIVKEKGRYDERDENPTCVWYQRITAEMGAIN